MYIFYILILLPKNFNLKANISNNDSSDSKIDAKCIESGFVYYGDYFITGVFDTFLDREDFTQNDDSKNFYYDPNSSKEDSNFNKTFLNKLYTDYSNTYYFINIKIFSEDTAINVNYDSNDLLRANGVINSYKNILYTSIGVYTFSKDVSFN